MCECGGLALDVWLDSAAADAGGCMHFLWKMIFFAGDDNFCHSCQWQRAMWWGIVHESGNGWLLTTADADDKVRKAVWRWSTSKGIFNQQKSELDIVLNNKCSLVTLSIAIVVVVAGHIEYFVWLQFTNCHPWKTIRNSNWLFLFRSMFPVPMCLCVYVRPKFAQSCQTLQSQTIQTDDSIWRTSIVV